MITISGYSELNEEPFGVEINDHYCHVNCCGIDRITNRSILQSRPMGRNDYYILYIIKGQIDGNVNNTPLYLKSGEIIFIPPQIKHTFKYDYHYSQEVFWMHFTGYGIRSLLKALHLDSLKIYSIGIQEDCNLLFHSIIHELQLKNDYYNELCSGYLMTLLTKISRYTTGTNYDNNDLLGVLTYMHKTYTQKHSIKELSTICNLTPYHFIHKFKAHTGLSPMKYLSSIRFEQAKKLLSSSNLNVSEVSHTIGYNDPLYFSKLFKKHTGASPSAYRTIYHELR